MIPPPRWDLQRFEADSREAIAIFRRERLQEPLEAYLQLFDQYQGIFEELLESTVDLSRMRTEGLAVLGDDRLLEAFRYLAGPPISTDDLKTVAETTSLKRATLEASPELVQRITELVLTALDRRRFPWVVENREPSEAERQAAVLASAALIAAQRLGTARRHEGKRTQEQLVEDTLLQAGFKKVPTRKMLTTSQAPAPGEFCGESLLGSSKGDFIVRLWDTRLMPIECKVSNSAINSVKRLNRDAAAKAEAWRRDFGETQVVPTAVLSGVFTTNKLDEAQRRGLTIFWAHRLDAFVEWINNAR